jgi:hypothetical protein
MRATLEMGTVVKASLIELHTTLRTLSKQHVIPTVFGLSETIGRVSKQTPAMNYRDIAQLFWGTNHTQPRRHEGSWIRRHRGVGYKLNVHLIHVL